VTAAQISIVQNLTYFEHLSEPMAEFLNILAEQYDYPQLADEVVRELSNKEFNSNDTKGPKSVSTFIIKLSELAPRLVIKQMTLLAKQLDSEVGGNTQFQGNQQLIVIVLYLALRNY
jgi:condensin complex subunit 1